MQTRRIFRRRAASPPSRMVMLAVFAVTPLMVGAQTSEGITAEQVQARLDLVTAGGELAPEVVDTASANYRAALERLKAAAEARASAESLQAAASDADERRREIARELNEVTGELALVEERLGRLDATQASQALVRINADQLELRERKDALERELAGRVTRPAQIREELQAITGRMGEREAQLEAQATVDTEPERSQHTLLQARLQALDAERERLQTALSTLPVRLATAEKELELVNAQRALNDRRTTILAAKVSQERLSESARADTAAQELQAQAADLPSPLAEDVLGVAALYRELARTLRTIRNLSREVAEDRQARERLAADFEAIRSRVEVAGTQAALGQLLRSQRLRIPDVIELRREVAELRERSADAGLRNLEVVDLRREHDAWVETVTQRLDALIAVQEAARERAAAEAGGGDPGTSAPGPDAGAPAAGGTGEAPAVAPPPALAPAQTAALIQSVARQRAEVLSLLSRTYDQYVTVLADSAFEKRSLRSLARDYAAYLDDRLLWVPSAEPLSSQDVGAIVRAAQWLTSAPHWSVALDVMRYELQGHLAWYVFAGLLLVLGWRIRRRLIAAITHLAERTRKVRTDSFAITLQALFYSAVAAVLFPSALLALGLRWQALPLPEQAQAVAAVMPLMAFVLALGGFVTLLCRPNGVGARHLHWSQTRLRILPRVFLLLQVAWLPLVALGRVADASSDPAVGSSLARVAFAASGFVLTYVFSILLNPRAGLPARALEEHPGSWAARLKALWYPIAILLPVILAVAALVGYDYGAKLLTRCAMETGLLLLGAMLLFDLLVRWLRVTRRRLRYQQLLDRRSQQEGEDTSEYRGEGMPVGAEAAAEPDELDLGDFDDQTRQLIATLVVLLVIFGCGFIWSKALPILGLMDRIALPWSQTVSEAGESVMAPVTAADALLAALTIFLAVLATRNLPGLLEFAVLKNLPLDPGSRYAIRTVTQYLLVAVGVLVATAQLGLAWSQVQWLVAALSVGLGFGLQEIFANFVSGLIILLERPVRLGDTVTVGNVSGSVTRIRIRATTITDWDNKEVIVPNKTFITGQLVNWTLSNEMTRVVLPIRIAHGSDTEVAVRTMMNAARSSPRVLDDPPPRVLFAGFGESSLDFEVFIYCRLLGDRLAARHEVLVDMERALREAGVVIPFPQRDVHIHEQLPQEARRSETAQSASARSTLALDPG